MDQKKRDKVGRGRDKKGNHVAASPLQNIANDFSDEHASDSACHPTYPDDRANCSLRKQIGSERVEVRGKALMASGSETNQQNCWPQSGHAVSKCDGSNAERADEHGGLASNVQGSSPTD